METVQGVRSGEHFRSWLPSALIGQHDHLGNKVSVKRPVSEDSRYPPKKRALLEHKAKIMQEYNNTESRKTDISNEGQYRAEYLLKMKQDFNQEIYTRPRSDSLQSNVSLKSENSDLVYPLSQDDVGYPFQPMFDHRTPERNPPKNLNAQIVKPLFQSSDSDTSSVESDKKVGQEASKLREEGNDSVAHALHTFVQKREISNTDVSQSVIFGSNEGDQHSNEKGCYDNRIENTYMGPMVSLIHRFNAEEQNKSIERSSGNEHLHYSTSGHVTSTSSHVTSVTGHVISATSHMNGEKDVDGYKCKICNKVIRQRGHFLVHLKSHEEENCKCRMCGTEHQSLDKLQLHMTTAHKGDNPYKCEHCSREFSQYNNLRRHLRVHRGKVYKCELCDREFNEEFYLTMHMGTHTGKRVYSCGVCNACFGSSHDLKMHVKTHSPSQLHTCNVCGKSFSKACVLRQHKKGHSGDRPHKCDKCPKTFIHRHHLTMHMRSHSENKPYTCDICKKEFYQSSHLYKHLRCHDNENEEPAVIAMREKLNKITTVKNTERYVPRNNRPLSAIAEKNTSAEGVNIYHVTDNLLSERSRSMQGEPLKERSVYSQERSRSQHVDLQKEKPLISQERPLKGDSMNERSHSGPERSVADDRVLRPVSVSDTNIYHSRTPVTSSQMKTAPFGQPNGLPPGFAANIYGMPQFPSPSYNPMYMAYAAQVRAYYNNMYMMNYMSHNAAQHPGTPVSQKNSSHMTPKNDSNYMTQQNGGYHMTHQNGGSHMVICNRYGQSQKDESIKTSTNNIRQIPKDNRRENLNHSQGNPESEIKDQCKQDDETRTEVAEELVKMSAGTDNEMRIVSAMPSRKTPYHVDESRSSSFTKCISDVIDKSVKIRKNETDSQFLSHQTNLNHLQYKTTETDSQLLSKQMYMKNLEEPAEKVVSSPTFPNSNLALSLDLTDKQTQIMTKSPRESVCRSSPGLVSEDGVLNLSQKKRTDTSLTFNHDYHSKCVPQSQGIQNNMIRPPHVWNNNVYSFSQYPGQEYFTSPRAVHPSIGQSMGSPNPVDQNQKTGRNNSSVYDVENLLRVSRESPKKRHASAHDHERYSVKNNNRNASQVRSRHFSDNAGDSFEQTRKENVIESGKIATEAEKVVDLASASASVWNDVENNSEGIQRVDAVIRDVEHVTKEDVLPCNISGVSLNESVNAESDGKDKENIVNEKHSREDELEEESEYIKALRRKISEIKGQIQLEKEKNAKTDEQLSDTSDNTGIKEEVETQINEEGHKCKKIKIGNYFDDSLEEKRLQIDLDDSVEKTETFISVENNVKIDMNVDVNKAKDDNTKEKMYEVFNEGVTVEGHSSEDIEAEIEANSKEMDNTAVSDSNCEMEEIVDENSATLRDDTAYTDVNKYQEEKVLDLQSETSLTCGLCWKKFCTKTELEEHQVEHVRELSTSNKCSHCNKIFTRPFDLQCHILKLHSDGKIDVPKENVKSNDNMINRQGSQDLKETGLQSLSPSVPVSLGKETEFQPGFEEIGYQCGLCDSWLPAFHEYQKHLKTHSGDKPYLCSVCLRSFAHKHNLNRHKMSHNSKSFECEICQRTFKESFYLQMHMKIHSEEKTRSCEICGQQVPKSEIWRHTNGHLGNIVENPTYEQIGHRVQEILREQNLNKDAQFTNTKSFTEQFGKVSQGNSSLDQLTKLMKFSDNVFDKEVSENIENFDSINPKGLQSALSVKNGGNGNHLKEISGSLENRKISDTFETSDLQSSECHICKLAFKTKKELVNHLGIHNGTRGHVCKTCGKGFKKKCVLRTHEKIHNGDKPFKCADCSATFLHFHQLQVHVKVHYSAVHNKGENLVPIC